MIKRNVQTVKPRARPIFDLSSYRYGWMVHGNGHHHRRIELDDALRDWQNEELHRLANREQRT